MAYSVEQRTHEIGMRMVLGADQSKILELIVGQGLRITLWGMGVGLAIAVLVTRAMATVLYGVEPTDSLAFAVVSGHFTQNHPVMSEMTMLRQVSVQ